MEYKEFINAVEENVNKSLGKGESAKLYEVMKNNGRKRWGLCVKDCSVNISPTIYLEEFYQSYKICGDMSQITEQIVQFYREVKPLKTVDGSFAQEYNQVSGKVMCRLLHWEENEELLRDVPFLAYLDLAIVFYILLEKSEYGTTTMMVRKEHIKKWKVTTLELYDQALKNMERELPASLVPIGSAIEMLGKEEREACNMLHGAEVKADMMYVLTNTICSQGAACILYPGILDKIAAILGEDYCVIPSSVHEVIVLPKSFCPSREEVNEMIRECNSENVEPEEVLSNRAYYYDSAIGKFS